MVGPRSCQAPFVVDFLIVESLYLNHEPHLNDGTREEINTLQLAAMMQLLTRFSVGLGRPEIPRPKRGGR